MDALEGARMPLELDSFMEPLGPLVMDASFGGTPVAIKVDGFWGSGAHLWWNRCATGEGYSGGP